MGSFLLIEPPEYNCALLGAQPSSYAESGRKSWQGHRYEVCRPNPGGGGRQSVPQGTACEPEPVPEGPVQSHSSCRLGPVVADTVTEQVLRHAI